jgi:hypothetical protein
MSAFDPGKFAAAVHKMHERLPTQKFTAEFARFVFHYLGPPRGIRFEEVAFRVFDPAPDILQAEMFVLGAGLLTVTVNATTTVVNLNKDITLDTAPAWVTAGDRFGTAR